jgi:hypothetical protein
VTKHRTLQIRTLATAMAIAVVSLVAAAAPASAGPAHENHCDYDRAHNACLRFEGSTSYGHWDAHVGIDVHTPFGQQILGCGPDFRAALYGDDGSHQFIRNLQLKPGWPAAGPGGIGAEFIARLLRPEEMNEDTGSEDELFVKITLYDCVLGRDRQFRTGTIRGEFRG